MKKKCPHEDVVQIKAYRCRGCGKLFSRKEGIIHQASAAIVRRLRQIANQDISEIERLLRAKKLFERFHGVTVVEPAFNGTDSFSGVMTSYAKTQNPKQKGKTFQIPLHVDLRPNDR